MHFTHCLYILWTQTFSLLPFNGATTTFDSTLLFRENKLSLFQRVFVCIRASKLNFRGNIFQAIQSINLPAPGTAVLSDE